MGCNSMAQNSLPLTDHNPGQVTSQAGLDKDVATNPDSKWQVSYSSLLHGSKDLHLALCQILEDLETLEIHSGQLFWLSSDRKSLICVETIGSRPISPGQIRLLGQDSVMLTLLATPEPHIIEQGQAIPLDLTEKLTYQACLPLVFNGTVFGRLSIENTVAGSSISKKKIQHLARFLDRTLAAADAQRRSQHLDEFWQEVLILGRGMKRQQLLTLIIGQACKLLNVSGGGIFLYDEGKQRFAVVAEHNRPWHRGKTLGIGEGAPGELIQNDMPYLIVDDYKVYPRRTAQFDDGVSKTVLMVPLKRSKTLLGLLYLDIDKPRHFNEKDAMVLVSFARRAVIAFEVFGYKLSLREKSDYLQGFIEHSPVAIISEKNGRVVKFNWQAEQMIGRKASEVLGTYVGGLYYSLAEAREIKGLLLADGIVEKKETRMRHKDGRTIPIRLSAKYLDDGTTVGYCEDLSPLLESQERVSTLLRLGQIVAAAKTVEEGICSLSQLVVYSLSCRFCFVFLKDESQTSLRLYGTTPKSYSAHHFPLSTMLHIQGLLGNDPYKVVSWECFAKEENLSAFPSHVVNTSAHGRDLLLIPMHVQQAEIGFLIIAGKTGREGLQAADVELARAMADQTSVLIHRIQVLQLSEQSCRHLHAAFEASNRVLSAEEHEKMPKEIVDQLRDATGAFQVSMIFTESVGHPRHCYISGSGPDIDPFKARRRGFTWWVVQNRKPLIISDIKNEKVHKPSSLLKRRGIRSAAWYPLIVEGEIYGVICLFFKQFRVFTAAEVDASKLFVNQALINYVNSTRSARQKRTLQILKKLNKISTLSELAAGIVHGARYILEADSAVLWKCEDTGGYLTRTLWTTGISPAGKAALTLMAGKFHIQVQNTWQGIEHLSRVKNTDPITSQFALLMGAVSIQQIPLLLGGQVKAVLFLAYEKPQCFFRQKKIIGLTYASIAATALEKARYWEQMQKAHKTATTIANSGLEEELPKTLERLVTNIRQLLGCTSATVFVYDEEGLRIPFPPTLVGARSKSKIACVGKVTETSIFFRVLHWGETIWAENAIKHKLLGGSEFVKKEKVGSCAAVPLCISDRKLGVMYINYSLPGPFSRDTRDDIGLFASLAIGAIERSRLLRKANVQLETLSAITESGKLVLKSLDLRETMEQIAKRASYLTRLKNGELANADIWLIDKGVADLVAISLNDPGNEKTFKKLRENDRKWKGVVGYCINHACSQLVDDTENDQKYINLDPAIKSELVVPIIIESTVIGVINLEHKLAYGFGKQHQFMIEALASLAAIAIKNAQQYEQTRNTKAFIGNRTAISWLGMMSRSLNHSIRGETGTAQNYMQALRFQIERQDLPQQMTALVEKVEKTLYRIADIPILTSFTKEDGVGDFCLQEMVEGFMRSKWAHRGYEDIELVLPQAVEQESRLLVRASKNWLRQVFDTVVDNAVRALREDKTGPNILTVTISQEGPFVDLVFKDSGPGFPESVRKNLFEEPIRPEEGARGMGVGLVLARTIVETYDGEITAPKSKTGAMIKIRLPLSDTSLGEADAELA